MATPKEYAYYIKGNKIALVEKNTAFDNDPNSRNYGPGAKDIQWESPLSAVSKGLQIEYTYSPLYNILAGADINDVTRAGSGALGAEYPFFGYTSKDGYLAFVHANKSAAFVDWSGSGYNEEFVVGDYILVENSSRWNGLHTIKSREADGGLIVTNTPYINKLSIDINANFAASNETITGVSASDDKPNIDNLFGTDSAITQYAVGSALEDAGNKQILKLTRTGTGILTVSHTIGWYLGEWTETAASLTDETNDACTIHKVIKDNLIVYPRNAISVLEDESFELDLTRTLQRAVVFYLKAKILEETMEIDASEYFMMKFRKLVELASSNKTGKHRVMQGHWNLM